MARKHRKDFLGAWHHVMNRGARREPIFKLDRDCDLFLGVLGEAVERFELEVHSFSLMPNHYHLLARSVLGNVSRSMQYLNSTYTLRFNARYGLDGSVFRGRFANQIVSNRRYQRLLVAYLHLNPVKAHLVNRPEAARWTSHRAYIGVDVPPPWLTTDFVLDLFGGPEPLHRFVMDVHRGAVRVPKEFGEDGWLRSDRDVEEIIDFSGNPFDLAPVHELSPVRSVRTMSTEKALMEVCRLTGASLENIRRTQRGRGANPERRFAAWALMRSTNCSQREVAGLLRMPHRQVESLLHRIRTGKQGRDLLAWISVWQAREGEMQNAGV